jgi:hypothetical protein
MRRRKGDARGGGRKGVRKFSQHASREARRRRSYCSPKRLLCHLEMFAIPSTIGSTRNARDGVLPVSAGRTASNARKDSGWTMAIAAGESATRNNSVGGSMVFLMGGRGSTPGGESSNVLACVAELPMGRRTLCLEKWKTPVRGPGSGNAAAAVDATCSGRFPDPGPAMPRQHGRHRNAVSGGMERNAGWTAFEAGDMKRTEGIASSRWMKATPEACHCLVMIGQALRVCLK